MSFQSVKRNTTIESGNPVAIVTYLICIITGGLCSSITHSFSMMTSRRGVCYWRRREFPNYTWLHRGRIVLTLVIHYNFSSVAALMWQFKASFVCQLSLVVIYKCDSPMALMHMVGMWLAKGGLLWGSSLAPKNESRHTSCSWTWDSCHVINKGGK